MADKNRWKAAAVIMAAFTLGNLFATACGGEGGLFNKANAGGDEGDDQDISGLVSEVAGLVSEVAGLASALAATQAEVARLGSEGGSLGHMTDDQSFNGHPPSSNSWPGTWQTIELEQSHGEATWAQGPNSDSSMAYDDCF